MSAHGRLVLFCSNRKYDWCTDSCLLLGRCPLLGMSVIRSSTVLVLIAYEHNGAFTELSRNYL